MNTDKLKAQLIIDEDLKLKPYIDTVGKTTIGVGRCLDDRGITKAEALYLLDNDIASVSTELSAALPWFSKLDDARQNVLLNCAFNLGVGGLLKFVKTLEFVKQGNYKAAAAELLKSKWAGQVGDRAKRLSQIMDTGILP